MTVEYEQMINKRIFLYVAVTALAAMALSTIAVGQQFVFKAPTPADWAALSRLPDFSGVWERSGVGGGGNAAFGTAPANRGAAPQRGAGTENAQARGGRGARGGGGPSFTPKYEAMRAA